MAYQVWEWTRSQLAVWSGHDHADRLEVVVNASWIPRDDAEGSAASKVVTAIVRAALAHQRALSREKFEALFR